MNPGPLNAITDVPGILVGHHQRIGDGWGTGTTVVLVPDGAVGAVDGRGGAPGTRETDLLKPENMVRRVNAVCLTGGSAYGLAAADGVMRWLSERNHGFRVGRQPHEVVPIVPAAVLFDLPRGDWGNRPTADFGYAACEAATDHAPAQGTVGAGTGTKLGSFKGGLGTASVVLSDGAVVGAIVAANALGEAVDVTTGRPWAAGLELDGEFHAHWPDRPALMPAGAGTGEAAPLNTTIGVVAVNRALSKAECRRLAMAAQDGLARAIRPGLQGLPDKLPRRELPKALVWLAAPFVGMTRAYVSKNVGHPIQFDNRRGVAELGLAYRSPEQTFHDHVAQLLRDRLVGP